MSVYVAIPVYRSYDGWAKFTRNLLTMQTQLPSGSEIDFRDSFGGVSHQRNVLTERFLDRGHDYILYLDDDIMPNTNPAIKGAGGKTAIEWLLDAASRGAWAVTALVPRCNPPHIPPMGHICPDGKFRDLLDFPWDKSFEVDYAGSACLLVKREAILELRKPWFQMQFYPFLSEDYYFTRKLRNTGLSLFAEPRAWCIHVKGGKLYGITSFKRYLDRDDVNRWITDPRYSAR